MRVIAVNYDHLSAARASLHVQCRKCPACMNRRRRMWAARAACEVSIAKRTWMVTLTASPSTMSRWLNAIGVQYRPGIGRDLSAVQYDRLVKAAYSDVQRWKKRLAKDLSGLKFLIVVERHTSDKKNKAWAKAGMGDYYGLPHFHGFVHERDVAVPYVKFKRTARSIGFFKAKLVRSEVKKAVWYVVKYLTKEHGARIWPSFRYGRNLPVGGANEQPQAAAPKIHDFDDVPSTGGKIKKIAE